MKTLHNRLDDVVVYFEVWNYENGILISLIPLLKSLFFLPSGPRRRRTEHITKCKKFCNNGILKYFPIHAFKGSSLVCGCRPRLVL